MTLSDASEAANYFIHPGNGTIATTAGAGLIINTNATENNGLAIDTSGRVGVGTASPGTKLVVGGFTYAGGDIPGLNAANTVNINNPNVTTSADQGYQLTLTETGALGADKGGALGFQAVYDASNNVTTIAGVKGLRENATSGNQSGYLSFLTRGASGVPAERARINSSGNVGIGTTAPQDILHLNSPGSVSSYMRLSAEAGGAGGILFWEGDSTEQEGQLYKDANGPMVLSTSDSTPLYLGTAGVTRLSIASAGNVGIGTTNPTAKLHVGGTAGVDGIRFPDGTLMTSAGAGSASNLANTVDAVVNADSDANASGAVRLQTAATDRLYIANGGNVGIGTTSPGGKLEVLGSVASTLLRLSTGTAASSGVIDMGLFDSKATITSESSNTALRFKARGGDQPDLVVSTNGNVGIGTTSPQSVLHVSKTGSAGNRGLTLQQTDSTSELGLEFRNGSAAGSVAAAIVSTQGPEGLLLVTFPTLPAAQRDIRFKPGDVQTVTFKESGNVGIGMTAPGAKLAVRGAVDETLDIENSDGSQIWNIFTAAGAGGALAFRNVTGSDTKFRFQTDGAAYAESGPWTTGGVDFAEYMPQETPGELKAADLACLAGGVGAALPPPARIPSASSPAPGFAGGQAGADRRNPAYVLSASPADCGGVRAPSRPANCWHRRPTRASSPWRTARPAAWSGLS